MSLDFLRSPDDAKVEAILQRDAKRAFVAKPQTVGDCPRCGVTETLMLGPLCHMCDTHQRDSDSQRAFCEIIHRPAAE
jgi:DTW domain-containing protein YfiP